MAAEDVASLMELIDDPNHSVVGGHIVFRAQARAILELRLQRLTGLERKRLPRWSRLASEIEDYLDILRSQDRIRSMMRDEMLTVKEQFATPRRTTIEGSELETDIEDLIREDMVVTVVTLVT